ncbi:SH3 domain-containing protein [Roseicyclus marinus]|uniref:SH3 domain-containing protein n=1 Tax=Roseicyclus marinus TaxID=2161673 RepID=UPI00241077E5|nr:SH3 domain-containing protein [Roseicyclus marinus]MDG3042528.1 SH3 domain-containing protein [Roseicyclus marinus]
MLRLSLLLGAAVYAVLVVLSETVPVRDTDGGALAAAPSVPDPVALPARNMLVTEDGRHLAIAAVISPALVAPDAAVAMVSTRPATEVIASASTGLAEDLPRVEVTGRYVNLRAGPSSQAAVLTALGQGEQAELIGADGNGWVLIRAVSTGIEGYMADRFVAVVN